MTPPRQVAAIERLVRSKPDAVISIPVGSTAVAGAFRKLATAGIKLVLLDNAPSGLLQETDYVSVVSSDNFGLGQIAASLISPHIRQNGTVCIVAYNVDFFATAQREIAFGKWMRHERPDITLTQLKFEVPAQPPVARSGPIWMPIPIWTDCLSSGTSLRLHRYRLFAGRSRFPVMTTVDLGNAIARPLSMDDRQGSCRATAFRTGRDRG